MKSMLKNVLCGALALCVAAQPVQAALMTLATQPLFLGATIPPMVMLNLAKDHQLHYKAYTDYSDLDGDGVLDITYKHSVSYYGYFDGFKCYSYNTTSNQFEPSVDTTDKYCNTPGASLWSGNFLNWATMTRIDTVRKLLYGGYRSTDTATLTVLERSFIPTDAHAFAKYYSGTDIARLTPFTTVPTATTPTTSPTNNPLNTGLSTFTLATIANLAPLMVGNAIRATDTSDPSKVLTGYLTATAGSDITIQVEATGVQGSGAGNNWSVENLSQVGMTICNVTMGSTAGANQLSQTNTNPPLIKVAQGNFALWASNERYQCHWQQDSSAPGSAFPTINTASPGTRTNGNIASASGMFANIHDPSTATHRLGGRDFTARVQVCVTGLLGTEKCKEYATANQFKPIGLLNVYGEPGLIHFGLVTGSFDKNKSGGVLRKSPATLADEINSTTDGTFKTAALAAGYAGIINTVNRLKIFGYNYGDGTYVGGTPNDNCQVFAATAGDASNNRLSFTEGRCGNWGNPMSEIYLESLRYFAGASAATPAFTYTSAGSKDTALGLPLPTWAAPTLLSNANYCTPLNVINFNAAVSSYDGDQFTTTDLAGAPSAVTRTNTVGTQEGINGTQRFIGRMLGATPTLPLNPDLTVNDNFEVCTAKSVSALGDASGICSEAPALEGSWLMSGLAHYAKTNRVRTDLTAVPAGDIKSLRVTTYGVTLASNVPQIQFRNPSNPAQTLATLLPAYRPQVSQAASGHGAGAIVQFSAVPGSFFPATGAATGTERGRYVVSYEVSQQGADYDMDAWGVISYCVKTASNSCGSVTGTSETVGNISVTTDLITHAASGTHGFGYVISGTNADGAHYHSGGDAGGVGFNYTYVPPTGAPQVECTNCLATGAPTSRTYTPQTGGASIIPDPLSLAAKYGGFKDSNANSLPDVQSEWDALLANGSPGADGVPDNFFLVTNPLGLETALNKAFLAILQTASASSVATNSTSLSSGTKIYQARFNSNEWSGQLLQFQVNADGTVSTTADWDAGDLMNPTLTPTFDPNARVLTTFNKGISGNSPRGIPFRWPAVPASPTVSELTPAMMTALKTHPATSVVESDTVGSRRLDYLRGVATFEGIATGDFRRRQTSKLGDIINSNPNLVGPPNAGHGDSAYATFRSTHINRLPVIYTAGGDGFVHGFDASTGANRGKEVFGYMPSKALLKSNKLTNQTYTHEYFVDGSPEVQDACTVFTLGVCTTWRTMLAVTMGSGGQSVSLLDITNPAPIPPATDPWFIETNAANLVKWEFTDADDPDLGFTYGQPLIRRMANGKWAVIVSGGYNNSLADGAASATGRAVLFILFVTGPTGTNGAWVSGTDYIKIDTGVGTTGTPAGLAPPFAADIDANGLVDFVYAGENQGGFWKFDLRSTAQADWALLTSRVKLFQAIDGAGNNQPITSAAEGTSHVSGTGFMINFGTGKYIEPNDVTPPGPAYATQSYYGIWDKNNGATVSVQTTATRAQLYQQQILADVLVGTPPRLAHVTSGSTPCTPAGACTPNYAVAPPTGHLGWFLDWASAAPTDLTNDKSPVTGERAVFAPQIVNGRLIFTTLLPNAAACLFGGDSVTMVLDNQTGARFDGSPFDTNGDGQFNTSDLVLVNVGGVSYSLAVSGVSSGVGITGSPTVIKFGSGVGAGAGATPGGYLGGYVGGSGSGAALYNTWLAILSGSSASTSSVLLDLGVNSIGRLNWREVTAD